MPHCIIDCPATLAQRVGEQRLLATVHDALDGFGVFKPGDIKVRLNGSPIIAAAPLKTTSCTWPCICSPGARPNNNAASPRRHSPP